MQLTPNYNLKKPEGTDTVNIQDFNDNTTILDAEIAKKANVFGGDISEMIIKNLDTVDSEFPVPLAGEKLKIYLEKVRKFMADFNNFKPGIITLSKLANHGLCTDPGFALDARYGKTLADLINKLNGDITPKPLTALGVFMGTLTRNTSSITGKLINVSVTVLSPEGGITNDVPFFYINKTISSLVVPIYLGNHMTGYLHAAVNNVGDTVFAARIKGVSAIPANVEIYINFNCFVQ